MEKEDGKASVVINIKTAYNVNPSATVVNNTFNIGSGDEGKRAIEEAMGTMPVNSLGRMGEPDPERDVTVVKTAIMNYVDRVRVNNILKDEVKQGYKQMWKEILDLPEVEAHICRIGKQQGSDFNRDFIANIFYYLRQRKIYKVVYKDNINGAALAEALEGNKEHSVKHALRDDPPKEVCKALDNYFALKDAKR